ncbi:MAG: hypothetical protein Q9201_003660 [Fulgogasparrea decipioides]
MAPYSRKNRRPFLATGLGRLPGELRDKIYRLALTVQVDPNSTRYPYTRCCHKYRGGDRKDGLMWYSPGNTIYTTRPSKWLGLLLVCRQMHQEAVHIWFAINYFEFETSNGLFNMTYNYPSRAAFLKSIRIREVSGDPIHFFRALTKCTNLSSLTIWVMAGWSGTTPHTHWLSQCARPRIQEVVERVKGLKTVEFQSFEWQWGASTLWPMRLMAYPLQPPNWSPYHIEIANRMRAKMLEPKLASGEENDLGTSSDVEKRKRGISEVEKESGDVATNGKRQCTEAGVTCSIDESSTAQE